MSPRSQRGEEGSIPFQGTMNNFDYNVQLAPWTDEEVRSLSEYQACEYFHSFTHCDHQTLIATKDGWVCPKCSNSDQKWCHIWMANGDWRESARESEKFLSNLRVRKLLAGQNNTEEKE